jgi:transposase
MGQGKLVFAQLSEHLPRAAFIKSAARHAGRYPMLSFSHWDQFLCMMFAQLTSRGSLRDITMCLRSQSAKLYRAGFRGTIARSTLADANERRDCRIFEEFALHLIALARPLYANDSLAVELQQTVYAIDASTIDLCLSLFAWAPAANARAGIKLHTLLDLHGNIPAFILITGSGTADARFLDHLRLEAGSFYVMDRAYMHFARLIRFTRAAAFFVVRPRGNLHYRVVQSDPNDEPAGVVLDQHIMLTGRYTKTDYPLVLRRIEFFDAQQDRLLIFLTNNFALSAWQIARLYKRRWQVELFFKWIKQNLRIKAFVGTSANAVKTQIWTAVCTYVLVAIIKKRLGLRASQHAILQVLSLNLFESVPLQHLLGAVVDSEDNQPIEPQLGLFGEISGQ